VNKPRLWKHDRLWFCSRWKLRYGPCGIGYTWRQAYADWAAQQ
jgi:hypothetical protein